MTNRSRQTLLYPLRICGSVREVLLGRKLQGFGAGRIMGLGGHIELGETARAAAVREAQEEAGVVVRLTDAHQAATIEFRFPARPTWNATVAVFTATAWTGEIATSAEMAPMWFPVVNLPLAEMWDDERYWLPQVLAGAQLTARFTYNDSCDRVIDHEVLTCRTDYDKPV